MDSEEKKELVAIIGQLNNEIYDLERNNRSRNTNNTKNTISFVNLGKNSPMMSSSAVDFLEIERSAMNEAFEAEIQSLKRDLMNEKETSKNKIESLKETINTISKEKDEIQSKLESSIAQISHLQKLLDEQQSLNLAYKSMNISAAEKNSSPNSEIIYELEKITKENEGLREKINDLSKTIHFRDIELQKQIQTNQTERDNYYAEIKRLTENSSSNMDFETHSSIAEIENQRIRSENIQLRSNLAHISSALQKAVAENSRLTDSLHMTEKKCSSKIQIALGECAKYKTTFASLQSLFNMENESDILMEINKLYQNSQSKYNYEHIEMLLQDEIRKNEELRLIVHMGASIPSTNNFQSPPSSPKHENANSNDAFLLQERVAQLEAEKEDLSRTLNDSNENCEFLRNQLAQKDHTIEENKNVIKRLQNEADTLRGEILSQEEKLSQKMADEESIQTNSNNSQKENEMKELLLLVESLREENDELRLTIGRKESEIDTIPSNQNPDQNPNFAQGSDFLIQSLQTQISQIQQNILFVASALKQKVDMPTPAFASFTEFLEEKVVTPLSEDGEINIFAEEATALAEQISFDYKTLCLVQNQCVSAYDQMNKFFADLKTISDKVENFYCYFDSIWESVCGHLNYDQENQNGQDDDGNLVSNANQKSIPITNNYDGDVDGNMMQIPDIVARKSPKANANSSFISLMDSPKIYRNDLFDQDNNNSDDEIKMNLNDLDDIPSLSIKDRAQKPFNQSKNQQQFSSSSRIPKAVNSKNTKSRIPLSSRQNAFDQRILSPKQAPSHIPELSSKKKSKFT